MALAMNSTHLAEDVLPQVQADLDIVGGHAGRYQIYRVCAHAKIIYGASLPEQMRDYTYGSGYSTNSEGLHWQHDQDVDPDEAEVIHHLNQLAATSPWLEELLSGPNHGITSTSVVTSVAVESSSLTATAQGRPISSFHRYSLRFCMLNLTFGEHDWNWTFNNLDEVFFADTSDYFIFSPELGITRASSRLSESSNSSVLWHVQFDFVDLLSRRSHPAWHPTKRRRTTLNPFHRVFSAPTVHDSSQQQHRPEAKRFNGVRYRPERRTWSAEMKPPKSKSKVYFGEFQSQIQAARIVDVAYHYYGKPGFLNFPDETPRVLSLRVIPAGLDEKCKLKFVKEQAKWLALEASKQLPPPTSVHPDILVSSSGGFTLDTSQFSSLSEISLILSLDGAGDKVDDGTSQLQPWLPPDAEAGSGGNEWMATQNGTSADVVGAMMGTSDEGLGEFEWNVEDARVDAGVCVSSRPSSSVRITDGWDGAAHFSTPASADVGNSSPLSGESQDWWTMNYLAMSPLETRNSMPCSPSHFQDDVARALMEQHSVEVEWLSG